MSEYYGVTTPTDDFLAHYGVKGMKWGVRKAIARGSERALGRQYKKASKKLAKLEKQAANGEKYKKRAVRLGVGAAAAGGLAVAGTEGVSKGLKGLNTATRVAGEKVSAAMAKSSNARIRQAGMAVSRASAAAGKGLYNAGNAVQKWGNQPQGELSAVAKAAKNALGGVKNGTVQNIRKTMPDSISKNTAARIAAGAVGAGLAGAAGYNAYRAATTKKAAKKAQQFRSEMNKAFAGTKYANGNPNSGKKRRKNRG